jgi:AbrB family looped-hinge helix DNA binding protein
MISYTYHTKENKHTMEFVKGRFAWIVKIGEKGQFVIPKEAREMFDLQPGSEILVLGDAERGLAILPKEKQSEIVANIFMPDKYWEEKK